VTSTHQYRAWLIWRLPFFDSSGSRRVRFSSATMFALTVGHLAAPINMRVSYSISCCLLAKNSCSNVVAPIGSQNDGTCRSGTSTPGCFPMTERRENPAKAVARESRNLSGVLRLQTCRSVYSGEIRNGPDRPQDVIPNSEIATCEMSFERS
jgi:hypothetical protein